MIVNILIFLIGLLIYAGYGWAGLAYLAGATVLSYVLGLLIPKRRWLMWVGVALNTGVLLFIKLQPLTHLQFISVLGISYFTLQIIAYLVDIYKGKQLPEKNFLRYALFVTYFPHLISGPIERYDRFCGALGDRRITFDGVLTGAVRAIWGGMKLLLIDARVAVVIAAISAKPDSYSGAYALAAMLLYSLRLYANFSGTMDVVLGLSQMLGLKLSENFDTPYLSQSFQEFWRRWHITLGDWLKNYIYIPLGGNRKGKIRKYLNLIVTFLVSGIWHGGEYLLWGVFNGIFVAFGTKLQTKWKHLNRIATFLLVSVLWSFGFVWGEPLTALKMIASLFTTFNYGAFFAGVGTLGLSMTDWIVVGVASIVLWVYDVYKARINPRIEALHPAAKAAIFCVLALIVLVFGRYGLGFDPAGSVYGGY